MTRRSRLLACAGIALTLVSIASNASTAAPGIVELRSAAPDVIAVVVQTGPHAGSDDARLAIDASAWKVDGSRPVGIYRYSIPWDQDATRPKRVTVRHRVYLELGSPLASGRSYAVTTPYGEGSLAFDERTTFCEAIKVNQVGYHRRSTSRFANFGVYLGDGGSRRYDPPPRYRVVREVDGRVMTWGKGRYMGDDTATQGVHSGEHVYRLSLDAVPEGGPYHVVVEGCGRSRSFGVGDRYTREIARVLTRGLYHQRCGIALERPYTAHTRAACHQEVADTRVKWGGHTFIEVPDGMARFPIRGGYHDAGDFDRRPYHLIIPILMLSYFEAFPGHFVDGQYDIPESGNGIPDFLDEAMWSLLIWDHLQVVDPEDPDYGGVRMGTETHTHPAYGGVSAASDPMVYGTFEVGVEVTALSAGIFAHASRLIAAFDPQRSAKLLDKARLAWSWLERHADVRARETKFMYAALQLYLATGEAPYHAVFRKAARAVVLEGHWPEVYNGGNSAAHCQTSHFVSYLLTSRPVDARLAEKLKSRIFRFADHGTYHGPPPEGEPYPQGVTKFMSWGAATAQGRYADVYCFAYRFSSDPARRQQYFNAAAQYGDFSLGLNPMGMSFVTGLGTDQPQSPLHLDSYFTKYGVSDGVTVDHEGRPKGNVPGIIIFGPTSRRSGRSYQRAVSDKLFPPWDDLPLLRRWGDGWSMVNGNEFGVRSTVVWNVVLYGFLYDASSAEEATP